MKNILKNRIFKKIFSSCIKEVFFFLFLTSLNDMQNALIPISKCAKEFIRMYCCFFSGGSLWQDKDFFFFNTVSFVTLTFNHWPELVMLNLFTLLSAFDKLLLKHYLSRNKINFLVLSTSSEFLFAAVRWWIVILCL